MMVVVNQALLGRELEKRNWDLLRLASEMGVSHQTVRNILNGESVAHRTQVALFNALGGAIPFTKLFVVTPGEDAEAKAKEAVA